MINSLSASEASFLRNIEKIQARADRAQLQVASGKRIFAASDEPDGISALLATRSEIEANDQITSNLGRTRAEVDASENSLQQAIKVLERARTLAAQGKNGFNAEATWTALTQEAGDLTQQLLNISNIAIEGRFIFAGNSDGSQPFSYDPSLELVTTYSGTAATRQSLFPGGSAFNIARAGDQVFDNAGVDADGITKSAFTALKNLKDALTAKDENGLRSALQSIETSNKHLSGELSFFGAAQRRIIDAFSTSQATSLRLSSQLSRLEDADLTASIVESQEAQFQLKAAFQIRAQRPRQSLFDYLG